jgi:hypothetical protein
MVTMSLGLTDKVELVIAVQAFTEFDGRWIQPDPNVQAKAPV